jgi:hypothetical protein
VPFSEFGANRNNIPIIDVYQTAAVPESGHPDRLKSAEKRVR